MARRKFDPVRPGVVFHLDDEGLPGEPGVRLALAAALYKSESLSIGRAARIADMPLEAFMVEMGRAGIPVIRGDARTLRDDIKNIKAWRAR